MPVVIVVYSLFIEQPGYLDWMISSHITTQCHWLASPCCHIPCRSVKLYRFWRVQYHRNGI